MRFRFFTSDEQDNEVARAMRLNEKHYLRNADEDIRARLDVEYANLEAWFGGDTVRLSNAVNRVLGR